MEKPPKPPPEDRPDEVALRRMALPLLRELGKADPELAKKMRERGIDPDGTVDHRAAPADHPMGRLKLVSVSGVVAAVTAVIASSCCALPMALAFMGVSTGAVGLLGPLQAARPVILLASVGILAAAWFMAIRRRSARVYPVLTLAAALLVLSFFRQTWDPMLQHIIMRYGYETH